MKPNIDKTIFGSITIDGEQYDHDILIRLDGKIEKRKKKLSKQYYGTSHRISLEEAQFIYEDGASSLIIGTGQTGLVKLSDEAAIFFQGKGCQVKLMATPQALKEWNELKSPAIGLFHITC